MRLLYTKDITLHEYRNHQVPKYAILSHKWDEDEIDFHQLQAKRHRNSKAFTKILWLCLKSIAHGYEYAWIDTCCIDKSNSVELNEAINSMYRWYQRAEVCFVFMSDVYANRAEYARMQQQFISSVWFNRGWTLQELVAPVHVVFFNRAWDTIGSKETLIDLISKAAGIEKDDLKNPALACVARKMSWASMRSTTIEEDCAYSLLGLFNINMPLFYGEGAVNAFKRLQSQILQESTDESIFMWHGTVDQDEGVLARSLSDFKFCGQYERINDVPREGYYMTNKGLRIKLKLIENFGICKDKCFIARLNCGKTGSLQDYGLHLHPTPKREGQIRRFWRRGLAKHGSFANVGDGAWEDCIILASGAYA